MTVKKVSVDFDLGDCTVRIRGAEYFYGDRDITGNIGADVTDEGDLNENQFIIDKKVMWQRILVPLTAVLAADAVGRDGAQTTKTRQFKFYCNPKNVYEAMRDLKGKNIDANLLPGNWTIRNVFVSVDSNVA